MATQRTGYRPFSRRVTDPFITVEEAWLWFWRCQLAREDGARAVADIGVIARPCDPDDLYRVVAKLYHQGRLSHDHVTVLVRYGRLLMPPDPRVFEENSDACHWQDALERLTRPLRCKGIVA